MQQILVYADSLSWGIIPNTRKRLDFDQRWPGVMELHLASSGLRVRVIEDCLNGRRTVWEDPFKPGRRGIEGLAQRIEINSPLALVILMLGTNDFQATHENNAWLSAQGVGAMVNAIRQAPIEPGMPVPPILIVSPPAMSTPRGTIAPKFSGALERSLGLAKELEDLAGLLNCHFFDAGTVVRSSEIDGIHLDAPEHRKLGAALALAVDSILGN